MAGTDISFELDRFEWATPDRLEVAGRWHGVRRRLARPALVVEVNGKPRRLQALPQSGSVTPSDWHAAFPWEGEMLKLNGAELEVGRSIVVELPRPRRSKARRASDEASPVLAATSRSAKSDAADLQSRLDAAEAEAASLRERVEVAEGEAGSLRERVEVAEGEAGSLRERLEPVEGDAAALRSRVDAAEGEAASLRERVEAAEAEAASLRERLETDVAALREWADAEQAALRERAAEDAEVARKEMAALRERAEAVESKDESGVLAQLRDEVVRLEGERNALRARLDRTEQRGEATQPMPPPVPADEGDAPRFARRSRLATPPPEEDSPTRFGRRATPPATEAGVPTARRAERDPAGRTAASESAPSTGRRPAQRTRPGRLQPAEDTATGSGLVDKVSGWVSGLTASRPARETPTRAASRPERETPRRAAASPNGDAARRPRTTPRAAERTRVAPGRRRTIAAEGAEEPSWVLRVIAFAMVAALLVALVIIVSAIA